MTEIDRITVDGERKRRFFMVAEVQFMDYSADPERGNYYEDSELEGRIVDWMGDAVTDRDDSPSVTFHGSPVHEVWQWIITANDGGGADVDDLIRIMERAGLPCPEGLVESEEDGNKS